MRDEISATELTPMSTTDKRMLAVALAAALLIAVWGAFANFTVISPAAITFMAASTAVAAFMSAVVLYQARNVSWVATVNHGRIVRELRSRR